jgi:ATP-binding cassette, subfamily F, member 3
MTLLQLQNGSKSFATKRLFDGASFAINEGEHIGVIGPNGAGKTTLFKVLTGQETLDSGEITKSRGLRVAYLEQEAEWALDDVAENYLASSSIVPLWELKRLGENLGLTSEHFSAPLRELSGGYRMRMKLLYLIGQEPQLMLLDEPTNFLDLESILALENFLQGFTGPSEDDRVHS